MSTTVHHSSTNCFITLININSELTNYKELQLAVCPPDSTGKLILQFKFICSVHLIVTTV